MVDVLPPWRAVLAVVAHPDDESFGLGALLAAFVERGATVHAVCFTHGEASTLHAVTGDLWEIRADELAQAAAALGLRSTSLLRYPDGGLSAAEPAELVHDVVGYCRSIRPDGLVVFDPSGVTGHPDHQAATRAALRAAEQLDLPVLGWTLPADVAEQLNSEFATSFSGHQPEEVDLTVSVDRGAQLAAAAKHVSQALPSSVLWRRLELLGRREHVRRLRSRRG